VDLFQRNGQWTPVSVIFHRAFAWGKKIIKSGSPKVAAFFKTTVALPALE
jgi:hypothetical protein